MARGCRPAKRQQAILSRHSPPDCPLPRLTHHVSRITHHFPMSKNVGANAMFLGLTSETTKGPRKNNFAISGWFFWSLASLLPLPQMAGTKFFWLNLA